MSRPRLVILAVSSAGALALSSCDRLEQLSPFTAEPSSVTVKLPPPRTAAPGFALPEGRKATNAPLR